MKSEREFSIRPATPDDLDAIMVIEQEQFGHHAWSPAAMLADISNEHCWYIVAVAPDPAQRVLGYAGILAPVSEPAHVSKPAHVSEPAHVNVGGDADIQTIAVSTAEQGHGVGRALLNALLAEAERRGARRIFLEVRADNPVAIALYESSGFTTIDTRPGYYQPESVDALVMARGYGPATSGPPVGAEAIS